MAGRVTALAQPAISLLDFLEQFFDVNARWGDYHQSTYVDIVRWCAKFQIALISRSSSLPADSSNDKVLIALSLRCLVLTHEINLVGNIFRDSPFQANEKLIRAERYDEQDPSIELSRSSIASHPKFADSKREEKESLRSMLEEIIQTTQCLMFRRKPEDWPMLLCTLFLIRFISDNLHPLLDWMWSLKETHQTMESVFAILCRLYSICSKRIHPLADKWKHVQYATLVNDDKVLVDCFQWMSDLWLEITSSVH